MAAMFEGGATPFVPPRDLHATGFTHIADPVVLMQRITGLLEQTLAAPLRHGREWHRACRVSGLGENRRPALLQQ